MKQAVILVGGRGSRISKITSKTPKPLIRINKLPFLEHLIKNLSRFRIKNVLLLCHYKHKLFFKKYHNKKIYNISIKCVLENKSSGTGGAINNAKKYLDDKFLLLNGDSFFDINIRNFINFSLQKKKIISIALRRKKFSKRYHGFSFKSNKIYLSKEENYKTNFINSGIYLIDKRIVKYLDKQTSLENEIFEKLVKKNQLTGKPYKGSFIDIGTYSDLKKANHFMKKIWNKPALILDRDGVLNKDYGYVYKRSDITWNNKVINLIKVNNNKKHYVFIITNQSGIGRGYYSEKKVIELHDWMNSYLIKKGAHIDEFYYSPYYKYSKKKIYRKNKNLRKPNTGMIKKIIQKWSPNLKKSIYYGDQKLDFLLAKKMKIKFKFVNF